MAAKSTRADKARQAAQSAGSNPYVRRLIEDQELRDSVKDAFDAARHAYKRMSNGKGPVQAVTEDKKVQSDLRTAAESLRDASDRLRGKTKKRRWGRLLVIAAGRRGAGDRRSARIFARRSSTGCSAPRRSSSTPRRRRRRPSPRRPSS